MKVQLTFPTKLSQKTVARICEELKELGVELGDWGNEKSFRFVLNEQNIQLSTSSLNITWEAHPIAIKIALLLLQPYLELLKKEGWSKNFLRIFTSTPKEWREFEEFKVKKPFKQLKELIDKFGIPDKSVNSVILRTLIESEGAKVSDVKKFLADYQGPVPKPYVEILRKILEQ